MYVYSTAPNRCCDVVVCLLVCFLFFVCWLVLVILFVVCCCDHSLIVVACRWVWTFICPSAMRHSWLENQHLQSVGGSRLVVSLLAMFGPPRLDQLWALFRGYVYPASLTAEQNAVSYSFLLMFTNCFVYILLSQLSHLLLQPRQDCWMWVPAGCQSPTYWRSSPNAREGR